MQISNDCDWGKYRLNVRFFHEEFGGCLAETAEGTLGKAFTGAEGGYPGFDVVGSNEGGPCHGVLFFRGSRDVVRSVTID
mmetsp:Transcript_23799/g.48128  ORF Transcript_23799/g.48128 Transcript_23799/m.48128 type:complete len:80 (-) Transcript_23799:369-608(-)